MLDCWPGIKWRFFTSISIKSTTFKNIITFINRRHQPLLCTSPFTIIIPLSGAEATNEQATSFLPTPTFEESNAMPSSATKDYYDEGQILKAVSGRTYRIKEKISAGGYGAVYRVSGKTNDNKNGEFALKVERRNPIRNHFKLTMEKQVLIAAKNVDAVYRQHFPTLIDVMQNDDRMFVVMTLLGDSLADIKRKRPDRIFSANTGFYCALQCLEAISNLHALGFVHRDIKPANFVIGRRFEPSQNVVYMVDYGIARDFKDANGSIKTPREKTKFKGTVRFAPLATHKQKELGRKDDCESWIYMIVDMIGKKRLPWQELDDRVKVQGMKEKALADPKELFPDENHKDLISIVKYLCAQDYVSPIDYNWMRDIVKRAAKRDKCTLAQPYDWMNPIRSSNRE